MKNSLRRRLFPWFTLLSGVISMAMQSWLLSSINIRGLLPADHVASIVSLLLLIATLGACLFLLRKTVPAIAYEALFPRSPIAAGGTAIAAIGMILSAFSTDASGILGLLTPIFGTLAGGALFVTAYCRFRGLRPNFLLHCVVAVFFIVYTMVCCQKWGAVPQLPLYLLPLLALLFLMIATYYRTELDLLPKSSFQYVFFSQGALMCCLSSATHPQGLFYLSVSLWLATDFFVLPSAEQE